MSGFFLLKIKIKSLNSDSSISLLDVMVNVAYKEINMVSYQFTQLNWYEQILFKLVLMIR